MEALAWLAVPFFVTAVVAVVLHVRDRRAQAEARRDQGHERRALQARRALGGRPVGDR